MPESDRIPAGLILAALSRAHLHGETDVVPIWQVSEHLGLVPGAATTRRLKPQLQALVEAGSVEPVRRYGTSTWAITAAGRDRAVAFSELPESPQHIKWRETGALARQRAAEFRRDLRVAMAEARRLLTTDADSDAWVAMAKRLYRAAWRVASTTSIVSEWPEPDDAKADLAPPDGRHNPLIWTD
jgi:hypothetical protein